MRRNVWAVGLLMLVSTPLLLVGYPAVERLVTTKAPPRVEVPTTPVVPQIPSAADIQKGGIEPPAMDSDHGDPLVPCKCGDDSCPLGCTCPRLKVEDKPAEEPQPAPKPKPWWRVA